MKALILLAFFTSCAVGPNYQTPINEMPDSFMEEREGRAMSLKEWWSEFNDPELDQLIDEAICGNYDLQIALARVVESRYLYLKERSNLLPEIDLNADTSRLRYSQNLFESPFLGPAEQNIYRLGFDASWEIDLFGKLRRMSEAAYADFFAIYEEMRNVYLTLLSEVAQRYIDYRKLQNQVEVAKKRLRAQEKIVELIRDREQGGLDSGIHFEEAMSLFEETKASLYPLETEMRLQLFSLAVLLGKSPEEVVGRFINVQPVPKAEGRIPSILPSTLLQRRPDIRQKEKELHAATARIGVKVADLFPQFSLTGRFAYDSNRTSNLFKPLSQAWNIMPSMNWAFIDFGRIRSEIKAFTARQKGAFFAYEKQILEALKEVESGLVRYFKEERRLISIQGEVQSNLKIMNYNRDLYKAGLIDFATYLDSERRYLISENNQVQSSGELAKNLVSLYKSLGGEWSCSK